MKSLLHLLTLSAAAVMASASGGIATTTNKEGDRDLQFVCDIPTAGCTNGMFNQAKCECECISPFCHDINGDCTNPSNSCGGNPWTACTRGEDCPWWVNPMKAESCTTGPSVPIGLWQIYNTKTACCNTNYAYSTVCDIAPASTQPTKHPTIGAPEDDVFEVIPIKFDVMGLPDDIKMRELKDEMTTVLKRILLRLADRIPGMKISEIEEKIVYSRNLLRALRQRRLDDNDVTLYYNVYVIRDERKKFGPLIIQEIRDSYGEVMEQIQTFADTKYFGADLNMNWCTSQNGKFELCVQDITPPPPPTPPPTSKPAPRPVANVRADPEPETGLAGWAIALIVIVVLLLLCCLGYFIFVSCARDHDESKEIQNNIYMDRDDTMYGNKSRGGSSNYGKSRSSKSRKSRGMTQIEEEESNVQIVLSEPQDPKFSDEEFTINTYGTKKTSKSKKKARDPTFYVPGQEDRPDPDSDGVLMLTDGNEANGRRYYAEDPPLKAKRDPTQYLDGQGYDDASGRYMEDPPLKPKRDPTMFVEGQSDPIVYDGESVGYSTARSARSGGGRSRGGMNEEGYSVDPYGMEGIDESDYDSYAFKQSELEAEYMTSETNAEYNRARGRDPTYYNAEAEQSFRTQEPSVSGSTMGGRSSKSKKSKKSKKTSRHSAR